MRFQKQLFRHRPTEGIYGDCARTVIACFLDIDPEEVPHVHGELDGGEQFEMHEKFLRERGYARVAIPFPCEDVDAILNTGSHYSNGMPYILAGKSKNGTAHVVICRGAEIISDPALDDAGIVGPDQSGYFWIEWIVRPVEVEEIAAK